MAFLLQIVLESLTMANYLLLNNLHIHIHLDLDKVLYFRGFTNCYDQLICYEYLLALQSNCVQVLLWSQVVSSDQIYQLYHRVLCTYLDHPFLNLQAIQQLGLSICLDHWKDFLHLQLSSSFQLSFAYPTALWEQSLAISLSLSWVLPSFHHLLGLVQALVASLVCPSPCLYLVFSEHLLFCRCCLGSGRKWLCLPSRSIICFSFPAGILRLCGRRCRSLSCL